MRACTVLFSVCLLVVGCATSPSEPVSAQAQGITEVRVTAAQALVGDITRFTVEGGGVTQDLILNPTTGTFDAALILPVGAQTVIARAFAGDTLAGASSASTVDVQPGAVTRLTLRIIDLRVDEPIYGPLLDSMSFPTTVSATVPARFAISVVAPAGDPVTYQWSSDCTDAVFSSPSAASTAWIKPTEGSCRISVVATSNGFTLSQGFVIVVFASGVQHGEVDVQGEFVAAPQLTFSLDQLGCSVVSGGDSSCQTTTASPAISGWTVNVFSWGGSTAGTVTLSDNCGGSSSNGSLVGDVASGSWLPPVAGGLCIVTARAVNHDGAVSTLSMAVLTRPGSPAPVCGDGVRDAGEQCDDGNTLNLDGCDSACQFEEVQRVISLQQQFGADAFCPVNVLGAAITPEAQATFQATWDATVADGTSSVVFKLLGLQDLTGRDSPVTLGFVKARASGRPLVDVPTCGNGVCEESPGLGLTESVLSCPADCTYDGTHDLDWWYLRDPASVDATGTPREQLSGQIAGGHLTAGPGTVTISLLFAFQPTDATLFDTRIEAAVDGAVNAPTMATTAGPPGHLASEHLLPGLTSVSGSSNGSMCSKVSAASFFRTPIPVLLQEVCTNSEGSTLVFTSANTLLDVFASGCAIFGTPAIRPTQPDGSLDGATYVFESNSAQTVTSCTRNGQPAVLDDCLAQATYSSYFKFATDRVILKRD